MKRSSSFSVCFVVLLVPFSAIAQSAPNARPNRSPQNGTPAANATSELVDYTVRQGDTCVAIARRMWGDARRLDLIHSNNPTMGPSPHRLRAGTVLRLPRFVSGQAPALPDAQITHVRNRVEAQTPEAHPARLQEPLRRGNRVLTQEQSNAELTFVDETQLQLGERTTVVVFGDSAQQQGNNRGSAQATLVTGLLRARLGELAGRAPTATSPTVQTDSGARIAMSTGETQVTVDQARTTRLSVFRGRSHITAQRRTVHVPEGYGSRADVGRPPTPPRLLPHWPAWRTPRFTVVFANANGVGEIAAEYLSVPGNAPAPARWRRRLARDEALRDLVADDVVAATNVRFEHHSLAPGEYFLRISAIDGEEFEGATGESARFYVLAPRISRDAEGSFVEVPNGLLCAVDNAVLSPVTGPLRITGRGPHQVHCAAPGVNAARTSWNVPEETTTTTSSDAGRP